ncbi:hypothetical protein AB6T38_05800 [Aliiglaciecola sp. SL4]|uniref:hypothetical protein n=1 Tax=Aliiglaciecola sp. SL4 TaxID=3239806 RepID=UPI00355C52ED
MQPLHFKTKAYRVYAPYLFKLKSFIASSLGHFWRLDKQQTQELINYYWDQYLAKKFYQEVPYYPGKKLNLKNIERSSDTIFVLGCGASINDLTESDWGIINRHDSIGVNYFYAHDFRPTYHMIELGQSPLSLTCVNQHLLSDKSRRNESVFMQIRHIMRRKEGKLCDENGNLYLYSPSVPKSTSVNLIKRIIKKWYSNKNHLLHHSSTLDCAIHFSYQMGYKNIYLLGVDLNNSKYFWDHPPSLSQSYIDIKAATTDDYLRGNFDPTPEAKHATAQKKTTERYNALPIMEYLSLVDEHIMKKNNIRFATCTNTSLLKDYIDYVDLKSLK